VAVGPQVKTSRVVPPFGQRMEVFYLFVTVLWETRWIVF
jgi:hypothetical protein